MSQQTSSNTDFDAIVVGARCAGSPTAMLLARKGYRVLLVDRATFPSDTMSSLVIHPPGVAMLNRWGLLDRLVATGLPPMATYSLDFGPFTITGSPGTLDSPVAYAPRRTVLDKLLVDAAAEAGAEVREGFLVEEILVNEGRATGIRGREAGGEPVNLTARVVVGADGRHSRVAKKVAPEEYHTRPELEGGYYALFSGLPVDGFELFSRPGCAFAAIPTHDDLTLVIGGWPYAVYEDHRSDYEARWLAIFDSAPEFQARLRKAQRESKIIGGAVTNYFRKPFGPGWALVGDAGYNKDPITAQGISDALWSAELCADALHRTWAEGISFEAAMGEYQATRDAHVLPTYEFTCQLATMEPPPAETQQLIYAVSRSQDASDQFMQMIAGVISPADFFSPDNVGRIMAAAALEQPVG